MSEPRGGSALATAGVLVLAVTCCGLPALILAAGALGSWFAANGLWVGAGVAIVAAAALAVRWWTVRRT